MRLAAIAIVFAAAIVPPAFAQEAPALRPHHVTLGGSVVWAGGYDIGNSTAKLRGNAPGATAPAFNWFTSGSRIAPTAAPELHVGFALTRSLSIDGAVAFARPRIAVSIAGDAEAPAQELPGEQIDQYQVGAGLTWQLPIGLGSKAAPFVSLGGAYLRQLHEDRALAETGQNYYASAGARYWLKGGTGAGKALGVRVDARLNVRSHGIDFENKNRTYPSVSLMVFVGL